MVPLLAAGLVVYVGAYVIARATGRLVRYEHVVIAERDPSSLWRGHEIGHGTRRTPAPLLVAMRPMMRVEELVRGMWDRLEG